MRTLLYIVLFVSMSLISSVAYAADYYEQGTPITYAGICFEEQKAESLLSDLATCESTTQELGIVQQELDVCKNMTTNLQKEVEAYKQTTTDMTKLLDTQIAITKQSTDQCKTLLDHAKPSIWEDVQKVLVGVAIGALIVIL